MRIPNTINKNCLKAYEPNKNYARRWNNRKIKSYNIEDWDEKIPKSLQELCIECISNKWSEYPVLDEILLSEDRHLLFDILSENLPLHLTIPKIDEDIYWKKCYEKRWPKNVPQVNNEAERHPIVKNGINDMNGSFVNSYRKGKGNEIKLENQRTYNATSRRCSKNSRNISCIDTNKDTRKTNWKILFVEMHVKEYIENLKPEDYIPEKIKELCDLCGSYVENLNIDQLLSSEISDNKIPLSSILTGFSNLKELCLCFKQTYANEEFSWKIMNTSTQDIKLLAKGLEKIRLQKLRITNSDIDCEKVIILLKSLLKHELNILDFSHCKVGDRGMMAISKFILENAVQKVILANNRIGSNGITYLSFAVSQENCNVRTLDLKLNQFYNEAGNLLLKCLERNKKIVSLSISACGLSEKIEVAELIKRNRQLEYLDISNNRLGENTGESILEAMVLNASLRKLNLRMCRISSITEAKIQSELHKNEKNLKKETYFASRNDEAYNNIKWPENMYADMENTLITKPEEKDYAEFNNITL